MKHLLVVAHGSRRAQSNDEVRAMAQQVQAHAGARFQAVSSAFLELAEPSIPAGIDACVAQGATEIVIFPYFLSAGRHVVEDVPALVQERQAVYPQVYIHFATYLGAAAGMAQLIVQTLDSGVVFIGQ